MITALQGIVVAIVTALLTFFAMVFIARRDQDVAYILEFVRAVDEVEQLSVEYWLLWEDSEDKIQKDLEVKIRGKDRVFTVLRDNAPKLLGVDEKRFRELEVDLFLQTTGGEFETVGRQRDPDRVIEIINLCAEMRALLGRARRRRFWAG